MPLENHTQDEWKAFSNLLGGVVDAGKGAYQGVMDKYGRLKSFTGKADDIAEANFPNDLRDASKKNAFRHALGTGMLAQELGGGPIGAVLAKMGGYGWEALGADKYLNDSKYKADTLHDFNSNNIGASLVANGVNSQEELVQRLKQLAQGATQEAPPGLFEYGKPHLTYSEKPQEYLATARR